MVVMEIDPLQQLSNANEYGGQKIEFYFHVS